MEDATPIRPDTLDLNGLVAQIDSYKTLGAGMPKETRIGLFRSLLGLTDGQDLTDALLNRFGDLEDETEQERLSLVNFVLNFAAGRLVTQNFTPSDLKDDLKSIDFENPLFKQDALGNWHDFSGPKSGVRIPGSDLTALIEGDLKKFKYCNVSTFDYSFESESLTDPDVYDDFELLIELGLLPNSIEMTDYAYFVWNAYMYPEFLLLAYANPGNVFNKQIAYEHETQWSSSYDMCSEILNRIPTGLGEILWYRPRILLLLSSAKISQHFDEFMDHWINLFPVLDSSHLSKNESLREEVIRSYLADAQSGESAQLDQYLDDDVDFTKFFTIAASCLYTNNSKLLDDLSKIDDETTQVCLMLNPNSKLSVDGYNLIEEFSEKFDPSMVGRGFNGPVEFIEEIARIATMCRDFEFVARLKAMKYWD